MSSSHPIPPPLNIPYSSSSSSSLPPQAQSIKSDAPPPPPPPLPAGPDSPRDPEDSPPPPGDHGDLELELMGLANALYNLGTTVIHDSTKDKDKPGSGKQVGARVNDIVSHLSTLSTLSTPGSSSYRTMIPIQVLSDIDNARNPMQLSKDRIERAATENQFMNAKIRAVETYRMLLDDALVCNWPELEGYLRPQET